MDPFGLWSILHPSYQSWGKTEQALGGWATVWLEGEQTGGGKNKNSPLSL